MVTRTSFWLLGSALLLVFILFVGGGSAIWGQGNAPIQGYRTVATATYTPVPTVTGWPTRTPTATPTATLPGDPTSTSTSTSVPPPPTLIEPSDGALMPQPISPNIWYFTWDARSICVSKIDIAGPGGRHIQQDVVAQPGSRFTYTYAGPSLPDDALGPWFWYVRLQCPAANSQSETRTFWVQALPSPTPTATTVPDTVTPTAIPTSTATPTVTSTPTSSPWPIYIPLIAR